MAPTLLAILPALPLAGFLVLALGGRRLSRTLAAWVGVGVIALAFACAVALAAELARGTGAPLRIQLWPWLQVGELRVAFGLHLDALSAVMALVITGVGLLIFLYSVEFMADDDAFARFFAYMDLFVAAMLLLVLGSDLLVLYLGWEGVGLCSFLLIGFWYRDPANGRAARKAFVVTRIGDAAMALGFFLLLQHFGTLDLATLLQRATDRWAVGDVLPTLAAALLLGGAVGKSAQLPLHVWLPDAMAGPTPVSALIHAATMVTAGVYLIARTHPLFQLAPQVLAVVGALGAATLLLAGVTAVFQRDMKRVLAWSTISQLGYLFVALGVSAYAAALFHLVTHAFFKAALFLAAGAVAHAVHHTYDLARMGGLRRSLPVPFWTFVLAGAALAGFPLISSGFYSKDLILAHAFAAGGPGRWLWAAGLLGTVLTGLYVTRLVALAFFGPVRTPVAHGPGWRVVLPLVVLTVLSVLGGLLETPETLGGVHFLSGFLTGALPALPHPVGHGTELALQAAASAASLLGIALGWWRWGPQRARDPWLDTDFGLPGVPARLQAFWSRGWDVDRLYGALLVRPLRTVARWNRRDVIDLVPRLVAEVARAGHAATLAPQNGRLRWYAAGLAAGAGLLLAWTVTP